MGKLDWACNALEERIRLRLVSKIRFSICWYKQQRRRNVWQLGYVPPRFYNKSTNAPFVSGYAWSSHDRCRNKAQRVICLCCYAVSATRRESLWSYSYFHFLGASICSNLFPPKSCSETDHLLKNSFCPRISTAFKSAYNIFSFFSLRFFFA